VDARLIGLRYDAAMLKKNCFFLALALLASTFVGSPCLADDFPGKGDRFAWSNALPYYNLANKYLEHGRFEEAKTNFEEAIYRYEYDPDFFINYGVALRKLENYTAAEEAFKKAIELRDNDWQSWSNLANAYLKQNRLKETIACFQKAMKMKPPPPQAEKEAMLKDIADINKILSMQAPPPAKAKETGAAASAKSKQLTGKGAVRAGLKGESGAGRDRVCQKNPGARNKAPKADDAGPLSENDKKSAVLPPAAPPSPEELKKSGWDWVH
jgi:tetratricopeptide (TPR) repeat protein